MDDVAGDARTLPDEFCAQLAFKDRRVAHMRSVLKVSPGAPPRRRHRVVLESNRGAGRAAPPAHKTSRLRRIAWADG